MNCTVCLRSCDRQRFIEQIIKFFIKELKLERYQTELVVLHDRDSVATLGHRGWTVKDYTTGIIVMSLQHRLTPRQLMITLAHEMVHVKQLVTGKLVTEFVDGQNVNTWCGKDFSDVEYSEQPWELQAFAMQVPLVQKLIDSCGL